MKKFFENAFKKSKIISDVYDYSKHGLENIYKKLSNNQDLKKDIEQEAPKPKYRVEPLPKRKIFTSKIDQIPKHIKYEEVVYDPSAPRETNIVNKYKLVKQRQDNIDMVQSIINKREEEKKAQQDKDNSKSR
jgi:hypothetical protein